jgi:hypothetical protein
MSNGTHGEGMICRASLRALSVVDQSRCRLRESAQVKSRRIRREQRIDPVRNYDTARRTGDGDETLMPNWPDPTPEMLASPEFEAIWQCIKRWDINVPDIYGGYCHATGNHVRAILDAQVKSRRER